MIEYRLIPLMVCSAKIGEELNAAAITRGLGGDVKRTNVCRIGFHFQDYIVVLICFYSLCNMDRFNDFKIIYVIYR